jgi:hypothetical protein
MDGKYAAICGYTQEELENSFPDHIDLVSEKYRWTRTKMLDVIRRWYDGYSWDNVTQVYNPFSTLLFLDKKQFGDYWFKTGTPTFLIDILMRRERTGILLEQININDNLLDGYEPQTLNEIPLLFQTGYLTVKGVEYSEFGTSYTLGIPNMEVNEALLKRLLLAYGNYPLTQVDALRKTTEQRLRDGDEQGFANCIETMLATVPNELKMNCEAHYHALVSIWLRFLGFEIHSELSNNLGRADAVWKQPGLTVVAELKYHNNKNMEILLNEAMAQIHERRYFNQALGRILLLGIAFSGTNVKCRMEEMKR